MTLRCIRCLKRLSRVYASTPSGPLGPTCAWILGVAQEYGVDPINRPTTARKAPGQRAVPGLNKQARRRPQVDDGQGLLFDEAEAVNGDS